MIETMVYWMKFDSGVFCCHNASIRVLTGLSPQLDVEFAHIRAWWRNQIQWLRALMFSLICTWTNGWVNNRDAGDLRRHCAHYDDIVMEWTWLDMPIGSGYPDGMSRCSSIACLEWVRMLGSAKIRSWSPKFSESQRIFCNVPLILKTVVAPRRIATIFTHAQWGVLDPFCFVLFRSCFIVMRWTSYCVTVAIVVFRCGWAFSYGVRKVVLSPVKIHWNIHVIH